MSGGQSAGVPAACDQSVTSPCTLKPTAPETALLCLGYGLTVSAHGLSPAERMKIVNRFIGVEGGYLGDFSYRTHAEFYPEFCNLDIDPNEWEGTTRERFLAILQGVEPHEQAMIVRGVIERFPIGAEGAPATRNEALACDLRSWADRIAGIVVPGVVPATTRDDVAKAIADTETLLKSSNGAPVSVDRVHTTLHSYLVGKCNEVSIAVDHDANLAKVFKELRSAHPQLATPSNGHAHTAQRIWQAFGQVFDALSPIRNNASMAHPNDSLLEPAEAQLVINAGRTVLAYLDMRLKPPHTRSQ